jgi:hypothetical protein
VTKRKSIFIALVAILLLGVGIAAYDPIYRLAFRLSFSSLPLSGVPWEAGMFGFLKSPTSATPKELLRDYFPRNFSDRVLEIRHVPVFSMTAGFRYCSAVLVEHNRERWIYLFYRERDEWHMKMFPV